jgi:hypothetical protein
MLQIELPPKVGRQELYRKEPSEDHASFLISESAEGLREGKRELVYADGLPMDDLRQEILAVGDFPLARRQSGVPSRSMTFGFLPRMPLNQRDYCSRSSSDRNHPRLREALYFYAQQMSKVLEKWFPERYELSVQAMKTVRKDWVIPNSIFTSGILNQDNPLVYHYDSGNFEGTWAVMISFKRQISGGHLVLPELGVKLACADSSISIFNNQEELHGVSPIHQTGPDSYRYTVVFYSMEQICKCGSPQEELVRANKQRTKTEQKRAGKIK